MSGNTSSDLVSIIVPIYNVEKYLGECIESIIHQTYTNLEIILVDDGATDSCGVICDKYALEDNRVKVIHKENGGLSDARNAGLQIASGEYIYFCDSDDYIEESCIATLMRKIQSENSDFIFFNAFSFGDNINEKQVNSYIRRHKYSARSGDKMLLRLLRYDEYKPSVCLAFFRASFLQDNQLTFEKGIIGEDELFSYFAYPRANRVAYCSEALYCRRIRQNSIMTTKQYLRRFKDYYLMYQRMVAGISSASNITLVAQKECIIRIAKSALLAWKYLTAEEQVNAQNLYEEFCQNMKNNRWFGDYSLKIRLRCWRFGVFCSGLRKHILKIKYCLFGK